LNEKKVFSVSRGFLAWITEIFYLGSRKKRLVETSTIYFLFSGLAGWQKKKAPPFRAGLSHLGLLPIQV
jgi:hypothetical protein